MRLVTSSLFFFFNDTATTEIYTLSLHDALPICATAVMCGDAPTASRCNSPSTVNVLAQALIQDRKSTRLNSSHGYISYAVFCLKKKKDRTRAVPAATPITRPRDRLIRL